MKIRVFQSDKGDCLLLTGKDGKNILVDGGMQGSYDDHVAPFLGRMRDRKEVLDLVYVSHIDQDHIGGVLKMMNDEAAWRIHKFQKDHDNPGHKPPKVPQPPEMSHVWHNAFHEQVGKNAGPIEDMLAANATILAMSDEKWAGRCADELRNLAQSKAEAVKLSRRIGPDQFGLELNAPFDGRLMMVTDPVTRVSVGGMRISVIGPFDSDLRKLRGKWNTWLKSESGKRALLKIQKAAIKDQDNMGQAEIDALFAPIAAAAGEMGDRGAVTPPNLASLMLLVEEDGKTVLLTGDGHWEDAVSGLFAANELDSETNCLHVDVLKIPHHGAQANNHLDFFRQVTADHYVFCGNGSDDNPEIDVVQAVLDSRVGKESQKSENDETGNVFKLWFSSSAAMTKPSRKKHMKAVETLVKDVAKKQPKVRFRFLTSGSHVSFTP